MSFRKEKKHEILEFIKLRSCRAFFAIPNEGFLTLFPYLHLLWQESTLMEVDLCCFFLRTCRANFGSANAGRYTDTQQIRAGFEHIWVTNAIPTYRLVTNLGLYFLIAFSWNSSSNRANIIQFKSPFSSPTSIFLLLRKPLFQELTLTRMGLSWNVEMQGPGCVFQSHLGRAVTEESYKGDLISLHVLTEFNSSLVAEHASQSEILIIFSDTTWMGMEIHLFQ